MKPPTLPSLEFLMESSGRTLQSVELNALNLASNLGKNIKQEMFMWAEQYAAAMLARWLMDNRESLLKGGALTQVDPIAGLGSITGQDSD